MYLNRKLRSGLGMAGLIPAAICIIVFSFSLILFGPGEGIAAVGLFFILYAGFSLWIFSQTRNLSYIAASLFQFFFGLFILTHPKLSIIKGTDPRINGMLLVLCLVSTGWLIYLLFKKKAKWRGREVFELASASTETEPDGFTDRPRPAGKAEYTKSELSAFARFIGSNLIAMPYYEDDRIVFVPVKMEDEFSYLFNPKKFRQNRSWISFDFNGNVTVNISRKDYMAYKEELSFDQLCDNMGKLFIKFIAHYRKGEAERIVYELNDVGLGLTS